MSGTYLYLVNADVRRTIIDEVARFRASKDAFEVFLMEQWGDVRYAHEAFLRDAAAESASGREVYYLAHAFVHLPQIPGVFMEVELGMLFLDGEWLPREAGQDEEVNAFLRAECPTGFRIKPNYSRDTSIARMRAMSVPEETIDEIMARSPRVPNSEDGLRAVVTSAGLPAQAGEDLVLLNRLCNWEHRRNDAVVLGFPMWIIKRWDNYEGYLTGEELLRISPPGADGFLQVFAKAMGSAEGNLAPNVVKRLADVQSRVAAMGPDTLCIAISSL